MNVSSSDKARKSKEGPYLTNIQRNQYCASISLGFIHMRGTERMGQLLCAA